MALSKPFVLLLGYATDTQREQVQTLVKEHANGWWHHVPDAWIVGGHDHKFWANTVGPILSGTAARLLVLELPHETSQRMFAQRGRASRSSLDWLWKTYYGRPRP